MDNRDEMLTAFCGLYCGDCLRYKSKAPDLAEELLNELKKNNFENYARVKTSSVKEFERYHEMVKAMEAIIKLKCTTPCRLGGDGCDGPCGIIKCVSLKKLKGCWECDEFEECGKLEFLKPIHGDGPINNLRKIRKHGIADWARYRDKCYPWL